MQVEVRLAKILRQYGLDKRGIIQQIADDLKVHRHTIGRLYRNQMTNPSLDVLGLVCDWLSERGVPRGALPQGLLGARPPGLWQAICEPGTVTLFLGERRQMVRPMGRRRRRWRDIAQRDAVAMANVVQFLSSPHDFVERSVTINIEYVPFRYIYSKRGLELRDGDLEKDIQRARELFKDMRNHGPPASAILIGSQRANRLIELLISDAFDCTAFRPPRKRGKKDKKVVPFYCVYRQDDRAAPSSFGGYGPPPGFKGEAPPGVYYRDGNGWQVCPWKDGESDAGVVVVIRDPGAATLEMALIGFTGRGTEALAGRLLESPEAFWPPAVEVNGRQIGIYICRIGISPDSSADRDSEVQVREFEAIPLS